jgi:polyisoprenoid-binding protein YceI
MKYCAMRFFVLIGGMLAMVLSGMVAGTAAETWTRFVPQPQATVEITGQGTLHDWRMEGEVVAGFLEVEGNFPGQLNQRIPAGKVAARLVASVPVTSLASGAKYRNRWFQHSIKADQHPEIVFHLNQLVLQTTATSNAAVVIGTATGMLSVAGVTNQISTPIHIERLAEAKLKVSVQTTLKLSDYGIESPTVRNVVDGRGRPMPDIIYSRDEVKVSVDWFLVRE